jgi:phosphate transport system substrate-binding protein
MRAKAGIICAVLLFALSCLLMLNGCKSYKKQEEELPDSKERGRINVSADESFKPIIDAQVQVFESNFPGTKINVLYKAEAECLKDLFVDSIRMVITTRGYSESEKRFMSDSLKIVPSKMVVARDAVAIIVHPQSPDSLFSMDEIRAILKGNFSKKLIPVFDGVQATSTVRFVVDSVLRSDSLSPQTMAARTSEGVIDYVANHPEAIGFIGVSWIGNRDDAQQVSFLKKVKIAQLESKDLPGKYILPVQANIYLNRYPMVRDLVYMLKERHEGLGHGFADFMSGEIGQLIFKRAYLMPAQRKFLIRPVRVNE